MTAYKQSLCDAMTMLGKEPDTVVCGYNTSKAGGHGAGSFAGFPEERIIEMPLAENNMMGVAIGLSLAGQIPIVWVERFNFALLMVDAIVSHLDKMSELSDGLHEPACIIRCVVGNALVPLFTGITHTGSYAEAFRHMVSFPVVDIEDAVGDYTLALRAARDGVSSIMVEEKDKY